MRKRDYSKIIFCILVLGVIIFLSGNALAVNQWTIVGPGGGGRQFNMAVDPVDPNILYVGTDMLGAYKSIDRGEHWEWSNAGVIYSQAAGLAVDPTNHNTVYQSNLKGVYKSVNGGQTWDHIYDVGKVPGPESECTNPPTCIYNHRQMHVGPDGTAYVPTKIGKVVVGRNNGTVWEQLDIGAASEINSIVSPAPGVIVVATENDGIIKYDPVIGATQVLNVANVRDVEIQPGNPNVLYALAGQQRTGSEWKPADFYQSTDGGSTWNHIYHFDGFDTHMLIQKYIGINSTGTIILVNGHQLLRSTDNGQSWETIGTWHSDDYIFQAEKDTGSKKLSIAADPTLNSNTWYVTSGIGVGRSDDNGDNWYYKVDELKISGISKCLEDPDNANNIFCGVWDNQFIMSRDGGTTWTSPAYMIHGGYFGDIVDLAFDPDDTGIIYSLVTQPNDAYILRGQDVGGTWTWTKLKEVIGNVKNDLGNIRFDPLDHNKIYVSLGLTDNTVGVLTTADRGTSWDWMNNGLPATTPYLQFMDIASNGNLYLGTYNEGIFKYNNNLGVWEVIYRVQGLRSGSLSTDPNNPDTLWVGCGGGGACKSTDGGTTWYPMTTSIAGNYYVAATHTTESGVVFIEFWNGGGNLYEEISLSGVSALDSIGVWYSVDGGLNWTKFTEGAIDPRIRTFTSNSKRIWAATYTSPIYFECTDNDGDGYAAEVGPCATPVTVDCNDTNAATYPGAVEICDSIDNNCDGYDGFDADGDGFTTCAGDCNDNNTMINPGASEQCDGIDNDCDNTIDESFDADSDGYTICGGDCNDSDTGIHPGATEICGNNIDENCDGTIALCSPAGWYTDPGLQSSWQYRQPINITAGMTSANLTDFPVLIKIAEPGDSVFTQAQADGDDIVFTDSTGLKLDHELEKFDPATGELVVWVKLPVLSSTADTAIYMYYGNSSATNQQNPETLWGNSYVMVQHLSETTGQQHLDSTSNNYDSTSVIVAAQGTAGKIGGADEFTVNNAVTIPDPGFNSLLDLSGSGPVTFSAWVYARTTGEYGIGGIFSKGGNVGDTNGYKFSFEDGNCGPSQLSPSRAGKWNGPCTSALPLNTWVYAVYVYDPSTSPATHSVYFNDLADPLLIRDSNAAVDTSTAFKIGEYSVGSWDGYIDEVRVSNAARSAAWIQAEYNNQNNPENYIQFAAQEIFCTDSDNDGYAAEGGACGLVDCNDSNAAINPVAFEICDNVDNNCNSATDENLTSATTCGVGACSGNTGIETCMAGTWGSNTCDPLAGSSSEVCDNIDNDCDGNTDEDLSRSTNCGVGACARTGIETCAAGSWGTDTCTPGTPQREGYHGDPTCSDTSDNDCDGSTDLADSGCKTVDLIETYVSNPPSSIKRGNNFNVTDTVLNQGGTSSGASTTRYYLSFDSVRNTGDKLLTNNRSVPALTPDATSNGTVNVKVPSNTTPGTYYLLSCADDAKKVSESNETNNCIASSSTVQVTQ